MDARAVAHGVVREVGAGCQWAGLAPHILPEHDEISALRQWVARCVACSWAGPILAPRDEERRDECAGGAADCGG